MGEKDKLKNKIVDIFNSMEYGENMEKNNKITDWLKTKENSIFAYIDKSTESPNGTSVKIKSAIHNEELCTIFTPDIDVIKRILSRGDKLKCFNTNALERAGILDKLAVEIEKHADLFAQIEAHVRGVLIKSTKNKTVPLLAQYFYYYSGFPVSYVLENPKWKPEGIAAGIITNENSLSNLGLFLAPALAAGYNVVLQIGTKLSLAAHLILDLGKKLVSSYKVPMIVFDNADLDSACENIIDLAWSNLSSWSTNTILVQENIYSTLLNKLKTKLKFIKLGYGTDKMADISYGDDHCLQELRAAIQKAKCQGVEVFRSNDDENNWSPTLIIGGKVQINCTLRYSDRGDSTAVTVLAFRSIDEAVNLANNTDQGFAASVWSENVGVINEVAKKLRVANVWVNGSCGFISADVSFSPLKKSGVGYFGGREGFYEYVQIQRNTPICKHPEDEKMDACIIPIMNSARKAQESWCKVSRISRGRMLRHLVETFQTKKEVLSSDIDETALNIWLKDTYESTTDAIRQSYTSIHSGYNLTAFRDPRGVIYIDSFHKKLIITALFEGNSILLLGGSPGELFCKELSKKLPTGLINILPFGIDTERKVISHDGIDCCLQMWYPIHTRFVLPDVLKFRCVTSSEKDIYRNVTVPKNVWCDIGKSSNCNLGNY